MATILVLAGCNTENPIDTEQYFKQVYIVDAVDDMVTREINFADTETEIFASVAAGGSLNADRDVTIRLTEDREGISIYNRANLSVNDIRYQPLPANAYSFVSDEAVIKKGNVYALFPILVKPASLHCDSLYTIPLKIASTSDYVINKKDSVLLLSVKLINNYSGQYYSYGTKTAVETNAVASFGLFRTLTAVDKNTVRFYHEVTEGITNIATSGITFSINSDNSLSVNAWDSFILIKGGGIYEPQSNIFTYWYTYINNNVEYRIDGMFTQSYMSLK